MSECVARIGRVGAAVVAAVLFGFGCAGDATTPTDGSEATDTIQTQASAAATRAAPTSTTAPVVSDSAVTSESQPEPSVVTTQAPGDTSPAATSTEGDEAEAEGGTTGDDDSFGDESADSEATPTTDEAEEGDGDPAASEEAEPETDAIEEPAEEVISKSYENRSPNSKLPANDLYFFDHDEIRALFPQCGPFDTTPAAQRFLDDFLGYWDRVYANWDTEVQIVDGTRIVSGWWTTEQIRMWLPESSVTAESAHENAVFDAALNDVYLGATDEDVGTVGDGNAVYPHRFSTGQFTFPNLYQRGVLGGYSSTANAPADNDQIIRMFTDTGIVAPGPNPDGADVGQMIAEWTLTRYWQPPTTREPTAWAMLSLLEVRDSGCIVPEMRSICEGGAPHESVHLRHPSQGGSRFGAALWSIVCPEITPARN